MGLTKCKLGELIKIVDERNSDGIRDFYGININKEFMKTVADVTNIDEHKYKVVRKGRFVYSGMQTGRDECIRIGLYDKDRPVIVSPAYTIFEISVPDKVLPQYFFMFFLSKEKDRLGWFYSDSSIRSNLDWDRFCDIDINLPPISVQQKYVNVYNSMIENQRVYESGLNDLKLVCNAYIEELRRNIACERVGEYIIQTNHKNDDSTLVIMGISNSQSFQKPNSRVDGVDVLNYKQVEPMEFAYSPIHINEGSIALNLSDKAYAISPIYATFKADSAHLLPQYLMLWFQRNEFVRYCDFHAYGSARETLNFEDLQAFEIPIPDIATQQSIADIYIAYVMRKNINERLKNQIKDICPILIKGSLEEASA